ncbi:MAG: hypothetical protein WBB07_17435 [Mycobacterium sp.]
MSAIVTVDYYRGVTVQIPHGEASSVDKDGYLTVQRARYGETIATFKPGKWEFIVITPARGPDGRFVKRGRS